MIKEIWKDIPNYENMYKISSLGNVKSLKRKVKNKNGYRIVEEKELKKCVDTNGYFVVNLRKNSNIETKPIHRLVAEIFIKNEDKKPCVNHIDGNKQNNCVENLEWCTYSHNVKEAFRLGLNKHIDFKEKREIIQYDLFMNKIKEWKSIYKASEETKIFRSSIIKACQKKQKTAGGYIWRYKEEN